MLHLKDLQQQRSRSPSPVRNNDDKKVDNFFDSIIALNFRNNKQEAQKGISFILVCHMAPTLFPFLKAIKKIGNIALIIPKGFQRESAKNVIKELKNQKDDLGYREFFDPTDEHNTNEIKEKIKLNGISIIENCINDTKFIIIDIGGYFSETFEKIVSEESSKMEKLREKFIGIYRLPLKMRGLCRPRLQLIPL